MKSNIIKGTEKKRWRAWAKYKEKQDRWMLRRERKKMKSKKTDPTKEKSMSTVNTRWKIKITLAVFRIKTL